MSVKKIYTSWQSTHGLTIHEQASGHAQDLSFAPTVSSSYNPAPIAVNAAESLISVVTQTTNAVLVYNTSGTLQHNISLAGSPNDLVLSPDGNTLYAGLDNDKVAIIDVASATVTTTISLTAGTEPVGVAVSKNNRYVYAACASSNQIAIIDTGNSNAVTYVSCASEPYAVIVSPDGGTLYVACYVGNLVHVFSLATPRTPSSTGTVATQTKPVSLVFNSDGSKLYVACAMANDGSPCKITTIRTSDNTVTATSSALSGYWAAGPRGMAISADDTELYLACINSAYFGVYNIVGDTFATISPTSPTQSYGTGIWASPGATAPVAPAAPALTLVSPTAIDVAVLALTSGSTSQDLQRAPDSGGSPGTYATIQASVTSPSTYHDTGLTPGATYWYRLLAQGTGGPTAGSASSLTESPNAPSALVLTVVSGTAIDAAIPALSGGAASYNLQRAPDSAGSPGVYATIGTTVTPSAAYHDTGRTANTKYWYRLVAVDTGGSTNGADASAVTAPVAPSALVLTAVDAAHIDAAIPALSGGAVTYNLQRAPDVSGSPGTFATIGASVTPSSTYHDSGLNADTIYWYRLVAVGATGSTNGTGASAETYPATAPALTFTAPNTIAVVIPAQEVGDETFDLQRAPDSAGAPGAFATIKSGVSPGTYYDNGLTANTRYWYRLAVTNTSGTTYGTAASTTTSAGGGGGGSAVYGLL